MSTSVLPHIHTLNSENVTRFRRAEGITLKMPDQIANDWRLASFNLVIKAFSIYSNLSENLTGLSNPFSSIYL